MVLVKNKSEAIRICCDFRGLNANTIRDAFPLPRMDKALSTFNHYSTLDLSHGFLQCANVDKDIEKTAFIVGSRGMYEFTRMPMGLVNNNFF